MSSASYPHARIQSVESLRHPLGMGPVGLRRLAKRASDMYFVAHRIPKDDGSERIVYDTREPLKSVLRRINQHILRRVVYPDYLTGGVPGKDYKSNVEIHVGAATVVKEDISSFFPSVSEVLVFDIWHRFFGFSTDVAEVLTALTTRDGHLEQGAPTSGYLANLALWDVEPNLVHRLAEEGFTAYSRHVDDIVLSSNEELEGGEIAWAVSQIYGTLRKKGLQAKRAKHEVMRLNRPIVILKLIGNEKASLPARERSRVRAVVHRFCTNIESGVDIALLEADLPSVRGLVHKVKRFHPTEGNKLVAQVEQAVQLMRASNG
ncbi:RNA-directed DNA polymerase [Burkholderia contaminans]|nr:RNA-directed DNA polymerase [Burkholderia contaminans]VWC83911.1 reverse transcriptase [Burkholderia contaminans]